MKKRKMTNSAGTDEELNLLVEKLNAEIKILNEINPDRKKTKMEVQQPIPDHATTKTNQKTQKK